MNPIDKLREEASNNSNNNNTEKDAWLYSLRKSKIITWVEELEWVSSFTKILDTVPNSSKLEIESGIVKITPTGFYIGKEFVSQVKAGFTFLEVSILLKARIVEFESKYGKFELSGKDILNLKELVYQYNRQIMSVDMSDKKKLIHLEQSGTVLYYLLSGVILESQSNGGCTLTFPNDNNATHDYSTIFTEDQIDLLKKVNNYISIK